MEKPQDPRLQFCGSYNSAMFKILSILKLCGEDITEEDMLEKTFSTFHTSNVLLQQQYRAKEFKTYASLISCLLLAEQNNELLMINSEMRPPGATPLPEAEKDANHVQSHSHRRGRFNGQGRGQYNSGRGRGSQSGRDQNQRRSFRRGHARGCGSSFIPQHSNNSTKSVCHRCGMSNHWAKTCRTPKHLVELYQESMKGKNPEAHMVIHDNENDFDHEKDDLMGYETSDVLKD
ncbi:uncharacterized protein LOC130505191 [Raphanus sativus]|uniref:Uncharacterized protein LOC130505191 n=1 Tax=Raphanus sativus TaxID=3726 RepID=A0A9W3CVX9_RAPSA|nr:uncharacterized protein LOC130505191 [Raphanus sativus]